MTEKRELSQNMLILDWLLRGNTITPIQALNMFGCFRLGARIFNLRRLGHKIAGKRVKVADKTFVQQYQMEKSA